jgi:hypothetical protein
MFLPMTWAMAMIRFLPFSPSTMGLQRDVHPICEMYIVSKTHPTRLGKTEERTRDNTR